MISYVNVNGEPITIGSRASHIKVKPRPVKDPQAKERHMGFSVVGYSPEQIEEGREGHEEALKEKPGLGPWDVDAWMSAHKPIKARSKPYCIPSSAEECASLMRNTMGWLRVQVVEVIR